MNYDFDQLTDNGHSCYTLDEILQPVQQEARLKKVGLATFISSENSMLQYVFHDFGAGRQYASDGVTIAAQPNPKNLCFYRTEHAPGYAVFKQSKDAGCEEDQQMIPVIRRFFDTVSNNAYLMLNLSFTDSFLKALVRLSGYDNVFIPMEAYGHTFYYRGVHLYNVLKFHEANYLLASIDPNDGFMVCRPVVNASLAERYSLNCKATLIVPGDKVQQHIHTGSHLKVTVNAEHSRLAIRRALAYLAENPTFKENFIMTKLEELRQEDKQQEIAFHEAELQRAGRLKEEFVGFLQNLDVTALPKEYMTLKIK